MSSSLSTGKVAMEMVINVENIQGGPETECNNFDH